MKTQLFTALLLLISTSAFGQKGKHLFEINPYMRMDWYPEFSYAINSVNTNYVTIQGTSWGVNLAYKIPLKSSGFLKAGVGYYRYSFNKMDNYTNMFGKNSSRNINYPSNLYILFYTDKYWYNCISANIGAEKIFNIKNYWQLAAGVNLNNYYNYSQSYHITYNNPDNPITNPYKLNNNRYFGLSTNVHAGVLKRIGKVNIGPSFILPVFDTWKMDEIFLKEKSSGSRDKWLRGFGVGITCNFSFKNKLT